MSEGRRRHTINWGQAFAEVILIVIGVALALAADDWADQQQELAEEQQYLTRLRADFVTSQANMTEGLASIRENRDLKLRLIAVLQGPMDAIDDVQLAKMIRESMYMQMPTVAMATYNDMVNSGDLRLLRSADLRLALARFEGFWRNYESVIREGFEQWNQLQVPFLVANTSVINIFSAEYMDIEFPYDGRPIDRAAIWSSEFENILAISVISRQDMVYMGEGLLEDVNRVIALIDASMVAD